MVKKQQIQLESPLPTPSAMTIGVEAGLIQYNPFSYDQDKDWNEPEQAKWLDRLRLFQQMVLAGADFDDCKIVYKGFRLKNVHYKALKIIHKYTVAWVKGYMVDELLKQIGVAGLVKGGDPVAVATMIEKLLRGPEEAVAKGKLEVSGFIRIDKDDEGLR